MSNRRRPERRDAHGAPVRTRREIQVAVATVLGVVAVTVLLVVLFRNTPASTAPVVVPSSTTLPANGSTSSTVPALAPSASSSSSSPSTSSSPSSSSTSNASTPSTTKP